MISLLINSINFPRLGLFCPLCWWTNDLSLSLTSEPFVVFSSPWPTEEGSDGVVWWAPAIQTGSPHPAILTIPVQPPCIYKNLHQISIELSAVPIWQKFVCFLEKCLLCGYHSAWKLDRLLFEDEWNESEIFMLPNTTGHPTGETDILFLGGGM